MKRQYKTLQPVLVGMAIGLIAGVIVVDLVLPIGVVTGVLYVSLVMISLVSKRRAFTLLIAAACTGVIAYELTSVPMDQGQMSWMALAGRVLVVFAMWDTAILSLLHTQAEAEVTRLKQLLSVCPTCKKIRDDKGRWQEVEVYITLDSGRKTYPGLCPECRRDWTPGETLLKRA